MRRGRISWVVGITVMLAGLLGVGAAAGDPDGRASRAPVISAAGVGRVRLGSPASTLLADHLIGPIRAGCPLAGAGATAAVLKRPLRGGVDFTLHNPRRVRDIDLTGGARTANAVGPGSTLAAVRRAYPRAHISHETDAVFGISIVTVARRDGGPFELGVSTRTHRVTDVGIPFIPLCD